MRTRYGPRPELENELVKLAEGWEHLGDAPRHEEALQALADLRNGAEVVRAGHSEFRLAAGASEELR